MSQFKCCVCEEDAQVMVAGFTLCRSHQREVAKMYINTPLWRLLAPLIQAVSTLDLSPHLPTHPDDWAVPS